VLSVETNSLAVRPLRLVLELAADIQRQYENKSENRRKLEEALKKATAQSARKRKGHQEAELAFTEWKGQWSAAIDILGLDSKAAAEMIDAQIDAIGEVGIRINDLRRERIEKIERDIAAFESEVADVVDCIAPQLADTEREQAVLELERLGLTELPAEAPFFATRSPAPEKYSTRKDKTLVDLIRRSVV
jgi:uncharacterized protein YhaN